jgi:hypothetical protein
MEVNTISNTPVNEPKREKKKSMICFARKINQAKIKKRCRQVHPHPPIAHLVLTVSSLCRLLTGPVGRGREELRIWWFSFKGSIIFFVYTPWNPWVYMYTVPIPKRRRRKVGVFFIIILLWFSACSCEIFYDSTDRLSLYTKILVASISSHSLSGLNDWVLKREKRYSSMSLSNSTA